MSCFHSVRCHHLISGSKDDFLVLSWAEEGNFQITSVAANSSTVRIRMPRLSNNASVHDVGFFEPSFGGRWRIVSTVTALSNKSWVDVPMPLTDGTYVMRAQATNATAEPAPTSYATPGVYFTVKSIYGKMQQKSLGVTQPYLLNSPCPEKVTVQPYLLNRRCP